ncbi:hypothetical protein D0S48_05560 [Psychrobacillus sp. AK 1817]|uniref:hypothetical protein n=1 Tax=Psychrobacillus sp. AK 1817 TaxID=2303505 RepID=UPI001249384B|nr:hypothetical protein [Psychrobacillus sp. AK 1817]QEY20191.1 hypothetical protein D0S48_05560 [Psychrobacillus sp. AK 1817]
MTGSSFSSIQSHMPNAISSKIPMTMKDGQVVHGTIKKLFPNQTAEVQIGNQKIIAKLETPLKAGDAHFFQVTKSEPEVQLKVVAGPLGGNTAVQQAQQLLQAMNLNKSSELQAIVQFFIKEQIPISKELLLQAEQLIKQLPANISVREGLEAIQKMIDLKVPLTSNMFETILSGKSTDGFSSLIANMKNVLQQDQILSPSSKTLILQSLQKVGEPFNMPVAGAILGKQLEILQNLQLPTSTRLPILQQLKNAAILPSEATLNNPVPTSSKHALTQTAGEIVSKLIQPNIENRGGAIEQVRQWIQAQPLLTATQKDQILATLKNGEVSPKVVAQSLVKVFSEQSQQAIFMRDLNGFTPKDHLVSLLGKGSSNEMINQSLDQVSLLSKDLSFTTQRNHAEQAVLSQLDGKAFEHAMKEVLKSLGFSYEGSLGSEKENVRQLANQLKPQLVELLQMSNLPNVIKEGAESILGRMNGLQLLSGENGPQHQLLMQIPLEFLGKRMDATLEWNGRMKEDGKIDSEFARIMFYLQLDSLKETVVDMQVQNKIVTINVFNDDQTIDMIANQFKASLKDGLASTGYQLSGVFVKTFDEQKSNTLWKQKNTSIEQGVDIRI